MEEKELARMQNKVALLEFMSNYNLSESARVIKELCGEEEHIKLAKEYTNKLMSECESGYEIKLDSLGSITIYKTVSDNCKQQIAYKSAPITKHFPMAYIMGKKIGKRVMEKIVNENSYLLK